MARVIYCPSKIRKAKDMTSLRRITNLTAIFGLTTLITSCNLFQGEKYSVMKYEQARDADKHHTLSEPFKATLLNTEGDTLSSDSAATLTFWSNDNFNRASLNGTSHKYPRSSHTNVGTVIIENNDTTITWTND